MDSEELKAAAIMAGMLYAEDFDEWMYDAFEYKAYDPALPSYVASLLVAMVRNGDYDVAKGFYDEISKMDYPETATDEQRIRAAMKVLGDE